MTREEEIWKAIFDLQIGDYDENKSPKDDIYDGSDIQSAFCKGAEWADANPKSPWISVKDDRPCLHEYLLDTDISTKEVLVILKYKEDPTYKEVQFCKMFNHKNMGTFNDRWYWNSPRYYTVTHWMPIPDYYVTQ